MQAFIVSVPLLLLSYACTEVTSVIQERFGIELCKRHCARYNHCYGIRYNITSITCTILNDRNTDGDDLHLSRRDLLQSFQPKADCAVSQYYSRLCIVNNKGRTINISETRTSLEEEIKKSDTLNVSSLHNLRCFNEFASIKCYIPHGSYSKSDVFGGILEKDYLPGIRYQNQIIIHLKNTDLANEVKILTLSVIDALNSDFRRVTCTCNITYLYTNGNVMAHYYGRKGNVTKAKLLLYEKNNLIVLFDRSPSGNFLHDMNLRGNVRGSIELPNLKKAMSIAVHLYLPLNATFKTITNPGMNFENGLKNWYKTHYNDTFL